MKPMINLTQQDIENLGRAFLLSRCGIPHEHVPPDIMASLQRIYNYLKDNGQVNAVFQAVAVQLGFETGDATLH